MIQTPVQVSIFYPADPVGTIPGGIDTFIRGVLRWAPDWLDIALVGVTTDPVERPPGRWTTCDLSGRSFRFHPLFELKNPQRQSRIPLSARFLYGLFRSRAGREADVLEFHRIEPLLAFLSDTRPKTAVVHQNMNAVLDPQADIRWKHLPQVYFMLESFLLPRLRTVYCVREDAVEAYKERFPALADNFHFTPTWVDTETFHPIDDEARARARVALGFHDDDKVLVTVGRLDSQKNPLVLLDAFNSLPKQYDRVRLVLIGDGILRERLERKILSYGLTDRVLLAGLKSSEEVARYLQAADVFVLSSRYEGMPISVLEALACGTPVASTAVGEVPRVVRPGINGSLTHEHDSTAIAGIIAECLDRLAEYRGTPCMRAIEDYTPSKVLAPIYDNYLRLARA